MNIEIDILENDLLQKYPDVIDILLLDHTTKQNIFWATDSYDELGDGYTFSSPITTNLITGINGNVIMPRVKKDKILQSTRSREMAEVFTPSWICNEQNNLIDNAWFNRKNIFNSEILLPNGEKYWETNPKTIIFPKGKTWEDYVSDTRLEVSCGEAPYITSRYDTTTGEFIPIEKRIGLLDRKLRVINENVNDSTKWVEAVQMAYKNIYAYEWQGDSLLLAREAMLITFIENYSFKFGNDPSLKSIKNISKIISWNIWQMDGTKLVVPNTCSSQFIETQTLFGEIEIVKKGCDGCEKENIHKHNGKYCLIKDWSNNNKVIRFIDLLKK